MKPIVPAEAPSSDRYAPRMLDAPSCVMSENRLTMPNRSMNTMAWDVLFLLLVSLSPSAVPPFTLAATFGKLLSALQRR